MTYCARAPGRAGRAKSAFGTVETAGGPPGGPPAEREKDSHLTLAVQARPPRAPRAVEERAPRTPRERAGLGKLSRESVGSPTRGSAIVRRPTLGDGAGGRVSTISTPAMGSLDL